MRNHQKIIIDEAKTLEILQQLIRLRTIHPQPEEKDLARYISLLFPKDLLEIQLIDHGENRASMVATLPGLDRSRRITLAGHSDTLPVFKRADWDYSPFGGHLQDGYVYGRGSANMKGGIAAMVMVMLHFAASDRKLPMDLTLCLCADGDSTDMIGASAITRGGFLDGTQEILFAEPTEMRIGVAQRGVVWLAVEVRGRSCYACHCELGVNALENFIKYHRRLLPRIVESGMGAHPLFGEPTCTLTGLSGGIENNIVPDLARGTFDIRLLPGQDNEEALQIAHSLAREMMDETRDLEIALTMTKSRPSVSMDPQAPMIMRFERVLKEMGKETDRTGLSYVSDASVLVPCLGVPFLFFGPGEDVYTCLTDERISLRGVADTAEAYIRHIRAAV